jgi:hypothetical protein
MCIIIIMAGIVVFLLDFGVLVTPVSFVLSCRAAPALFALLGSFPAVRA